jgi:hypothetical protein
MKNLRGLLLLVPLLFACDDTPQFEGVFNSGKVGDFCISTPSVSPDGSSIVFESRKTGHGDIYATARDGSRTKPLTQIPHVETHPVYSSDGTLIAFARQSNGYQHIWAMEATGSNVQQWTKGEVIDSPAWFGLGDSNLFFFRTTFWRRYAVPYQELFELVLSNKCGLKIRRVGDFSGMTFDRQKFLFAKGKRRDQIWLTNALTAGTHFVGTGTFPSFSPDGTLIAYLEQGPDYRSDIVLVNTANFEKRRLPLPPGFKTAPIFCLNGTAMIFRIPSSERDGAGGIYLFHLKDAKLEFLQNSGGERLH